MIHLRRHARAEQGFIRSELSFCTPRSPAKNSARAMDFDRLRRLTFALPLDLEFVSSWPAILRVFGGADQDRHSSGFIPSGVSIVQV